MRVNVISDLHLEFDDLELPGGDVLILSGDICEAKNIRADSYDPNGIMFDFERANRRPDRYIRFFKDECTKYRHVIYVMGNHEHYHFRFDKTYEHLKQNLPSNVHLLEQESIEIDGVIFIGATLWTDCNNGDPITMLTLKQGMNDYRIVQNFYEDKNQYFKLIPEFTYNIHRKTLNYFKSELAKYADRKVVMVTHHSPSKQSIKPRYQGDYHMNGGYSSDLEQFILDHPQIQVWTHGHTHDTFDYQVGQCRIICNPRGYVGYEERAEIFDPTVGFEITAQ
jgi:Icc-related predicted phosphoesterase